MLGLPSSMSTPAADMIRPVEANPACKAYSMKDFFLQGFAFFGVFLDQNVL